MKILIKNQSRIHLSLRACTLLAVMLVCSVVMQPVIANTLSGMELLKKMGDAANALNYSGEFVYVKDGKIASMKVSQMQAESGSQQKVMSLNGSMREIIQQDDTVACVLPDTGIGMREKRQLNQLLAKDISGKIDIIKRHYSVKHLGQARVAGRECEQLKITPKDAFRYGYTLCIDSHNHLLLRSELITDEGLILESYMFVSVQFNNTSATEIVSETPPKTLEWMDDGQPNQKAHDSSSASMQKWHVVSNESGFEIEHYIERVSPVMQANISHIVLGDGLANISVFISPSSTSMKNSAGSNSMGSLNSYSRKLDEYLITVIGEVPQQTVALIANNTELN